MRKFVLTLSLLVVALIGMNGAIAQTTSEITVDQEEPKDGPKISVDKEVHDYGTIQQGGDGTCVFTVTNSGNAPLIISYCKGSCGCTVPKCDTKVPIAPGETTEITVKYDTKRVGAINKTVTITSNAVNAPRKVIRIKGTVEAAPAGGAPTSTGGPVNN